MEQVRKTAAVPSRKKDLREKKAYRRLLWGMLFLELLLGKIQEKAHTAMGQEPPEEAPDSREGVMRWPADWAGRDSLEVTLESCLRLAFSEPYNELSGAVRRAEWVSSDSLLKEASAVMGDYYAGRIDGETTGHMARAYCCYYLEGRIAGKIDDLVTGEDGARRDEALHRENMMRELLEIYEYFSRANVRKAVEANNTEGRKMVEECGLSWAGTTYYHARFYHACGQMQEMLRGICAELADDYGLDAPDFDRTEEESRFRLDGGLSFHGVFEWVQKQNNYPPDQYGMREKTRRPPEYFFYLYRNCCSDREDRGLKRLSKALKKAALEEIPGEMLWRFFSVTGGRDYHNGLSYLPGQEGPEEDISLREAAMYFLETFRLYRVCGCVEILCAGAAEPSSDHGS